MTQKIRPSQFILMYGPGAILEGKDGPRLIPDARIGLFGGSSDFKPNDYRIDDNRMSKGMLKGAKIYRLPTNPELGHEGDIYRTKPFPLWKLCPHLRHNGGLLLYKGDVCPVCKDDATGNGKDAVAFVMACRDGHLDEIPWGWLVHQRSSCKKDKLQSLHPGLREESLLWHRRGSGLSDVVLECPRCGKTQKFGQIYYSEWPCYGRHPQSELLGSPRRPSECKRRAKMITRRAANLRLSETRTLLTIQSTGTSLHVHLQNPYIRGCLVRPVNSKAELMSALETLHSEGLIPRDALEEFQKSDWREIRQAINESKKPQPGTYHELLLDEFRELVKASVDGAPPQAIERPKARIIFEINPREAKIVRARQGTKFRITPIQTMRTVTVQMGFRRDIPESDASELPKLVPTKHIQESERWFPGVEFYGEGIFVRLDTDGGWTECPKSESAKAWSEGESCAEQYLDFVFRDAANSRDELNPRFVWWHTLSHLLIRAIGEEAGYSPASIRERVYFESNGDRSRGGILLYATQPGNEGTLGGLVGLVPHMQKILHAALDKVASCSGDPLCGYARFHKGDHNGASCYACLMTSETSCEHRNMWLDRHVLTENMP